VSHRGAGLADPAREDGPLPSVAGRLAWAALLFGVVVRAMLWLDRTSLWGDEAMLALNVATRSYGELTRPLDYAQIAPLPFLWLERLMWALAGPSEIMLRLPVFLAGCAALWLLYRLASRLLAPWEAFTAMGLAATSSFLARYSIELKPYSGDIALAVAITLLALWLREDPSPRHWAVLAATAAAATLASTSAVLVVGSVALVLLIESLHQRRWAHGVLAVGLGLGSVGLSGAAYYAWYQPVAESEYMRVYWEAGYFTPGSPDLLGRLWGGFDVTLQGLTDWVVLLRLSPLAVVALGAGVVRIARRHGPGVPALLLLPMGSAFVASALGRYPIATRTMLYALPGLAVVLGAGLAAVAEAVRRWVPRLREPVFLGALLIPSTFVALGFALLRPRDEEVRPVVRTLEQRWQPGDAVYVLSRTIPAWAFYSTDWKHPDTARLAWMARLAGPDGAAMGNGGSRGRRYPSETDTLVRRWRDGEELLGSSSGIMVRNWVGHSSREPDSGWVETESARIIEAARPRAWVVLFNDPGGMEGPALVNAVRAAGVEVTEAEAAANARGYLVRSDKPLSAR